GWQMIDHLRVTYDPVPLASELLSFFQQGSFDLRDCAQIVHDYEFSAKIQIEACDHVYPVPLDIDLPPLVCGSVHMWHSHPNLCVYSHPDLKNVQLHYRLWHFTQETFRQRSTIVYIYPHYEM